MRRRCVNKQWFDAGGRDHRKLWVWPVESYRHHAGDLERVQVPHQGVRWNGLPCSEIRPHLWRNPELSGPDGEKKTSVDGLFTLETVFSFIARRLQIIFSYKLNVLEDYIRTFLCYLLRFLVDLVRKVGKIWYSRLIITAWIRPKRISLLFPVKEIHWNFWCRRRLPATVSFCILQIGEISGRLSPEYRRVTANRIQWGRSRVWETWSHIAMGVWAGILYGKQWFRTFLFYGTSTMSSWRERNSLRH